MKIIDFNSLQGPESSAPAAANLISGTPRQQVWNAFSDPEGHFHVGRWASTVGLWRVKYTERELCHILTGMVRLTDDSGEQRTYRPGDTFMIDKGFSGTWEVLADCSKLYAIYE
jgi:uncharacterized protein